MPRRPAPLLAALLAALAACAAALPHGSLLARHRHIVTGCLAECGTWEQSCVTECQVCVEQLLCPSLVHVNCSGCLSEARAARRRFEGGGGEALGDSGGAPLVHEGIRQELQRAQLQSMEGHRALRGARRGVLDAQRLAEWALEERRAETARLRKTREELERHDANKRRWLHRNSAAVNVTRSHVEAIEKEIADLNATLKTTNEKLEDLQEIVVGGDVLQAGARATEILSVTRQARKLQWEIRKKKKLLKKTQAELETQVKEADWFAKGLRERGFRVARDLRAEVRHVQHLKAHEKSYRKKLRDAKRGYRRAVGSVRNLTKEVRQLQGELERHPLPSFGPPDFSSGLEAPVPPPRRS